LDAARVTIEQALSMPGMQDNARIRSWAQSDQALIYVSMQENEKAKSIISAPPPEDLGYQLTTRWQLVQSAVSFVCGDVFAGRSYATEVLGVAREKNLKNLILTAENMLSTSDHSPANLARILLVG